MDKRGTNAASGKENKNDVSRNHQHRHNQPTPSKRRVDLGAPAQYYFKYMNSSKKQQQHHHTGELNASMMSNGGGVGLGLGEEGQDDTGTISIPGNHLGGGEHNTETSFFSIAAESSSGSEASDLLNKSTLSDTTELTASNFVLATTSKQQLARSAYQHNRTERELKAERALAILEREAAALAKEESEQNADTSDFEDLRDLTEEKQHKTVPVNETSQSAFNPVARESIGGDIGQPDFRENMGIRDGSPSLRLRVSSSPASLKNLTQHYRSTREKRQMQREQDAKRRLSVESADSIPDMHAQLEALTTDTNLSRQRLPPRFGPTPQQFSRESIGSKVSSPVGSVAASHTESTSFVNMDDLNDLLEISHANDDRRKSSIMAHHTDLVQALGTETQDANNGNAARLDKKGSIILDSTPSVDDSKNPSASSYNTGVDKDEVGRDSTYQSKSPQRPKSPLPSNFRRKPGSKNKLTPARLSVGPKRVVNPQYLFSPAKNTCSAKKEDTTEFEALPSSAKSVASSFSGKSDETASLDDIEELFGKTTPDESSPSIQSRSSDIFSDQSVADKSPHEENCLRERPLVNQETASIDDIREILGQNTTGIQDHGGLGRRSSVGSVDQANYPGYEIEDNTTSHERRQSSSVLVNRPEVDLSTPVSNGSGSQQEARDGQNKSTSSKTERPHFKEIPTLHDKDSFLSPSDGTPTTPPNVNLSAMSPSVNRLLSQSKVSPPVNVLKSAEKKIADLDSSMVSLKDPMRLVPNAHLAPTPTRLAPTPRRVLNPNNPNSPARNTRSSARNGQSPLARLDSPSDLKRRRDDLARPAQLFSEEGVSHSSKRRRRSSVAPSLASVRNETKPHGIMSSKKKPFSSQRSVAFGSPKAAEYNIGSPSVSLTPMPSGRAKALFRLPSGEENNRSILEDEGDMAKSHLKIEESANKSMDIEPGLSVLVDRISADNMNSSPELSPIAKSSSDTGVFNVRISALSASTVERNIQEGEKTVELEVGMDSLLEHALDSPAESDAYTPSQHETSMEMMDAETIASMHSRRSDKFTTEFALPIGQKLDFSVATEEDLANDDEMDVQVEEGHAVILEDGMIDKNNETHSHDLSNDESFDSRSVVATNVPTFQEGRTIELEANMTELIGTARSDALPNETSISMKTSSQALVLQQQKGETLELEGNMTELLAVAGHDTNKENCGLEGDEDQTEVDLNVTGESLDTVEMTNEITGRKSIASQSFTLHQPDQLAVSVDDVAHRSILVNEKSVSFCDTNKFILATNSASSDEPSTEEELSTPLSEDQIAAFSSKLFHLHKMKENDSPSIISVDALSQFGSSSGTKDVVVFERLRQFVELVCSEVEKNTDPEGTALEGLKSMIGEVPELFSLLNKRLVDCEERNGECLSSLQLVIENGRKAIGFEWNDWLNTVLQSFQGPLDNIPASLMEDCSSLDNALQECSQNHDILAMINDAKAQHARKRSLQRRRQTVQDLETAVSLIEKQITNFECDLEALGTEEMEAEVERTYLHDVGQLAAKFDVVRPTAEGSQKAYLSLRGLHSWSLGSMGEGRLKICTNSVCPQTALTLSYSWQNDVVESQMTISSASTQGIPQFRYQGPLSSYLDTAVRLLTKEIAQQNLNEASSVRRHVQKYAWLVGRLDFAAKELYVLQRRYKAKVVRTDKDSFSLRIRLETNAASVNVEFPLDTMYPAFPVEVRLELTSGNLDLAEVRKSLIKQSKPGFGSLSRACDIVESFVKG